MNKETSKNTSHNSLDKEIYINHKIHHSGKNSLSSSQKNKQESLEDAIIDLYLSIKIRKQEEIEMYNDEIRKKEISILKRNCPLTIIDYIKTSIEILINLRVQEKVNESIRTSQNSNLGSPYSPKAETTTNSSSNIQYEELLREMESELRKKAQRELQLKFKVEFLETKIKELERKIEEVTKDKEKYLNILDQIKIENNSSPSEGILQQSASFARNFGLDSFQKKVSNEDENPLHVMSFAATGNQNQSSLPDQIEKKMYKQQKQFEERIFKMEEINRDQIANLTEKLNKYERLLTSEFSKRKGFDENFKVNTSSSEISTIHKNYTPSSNPVFIIKHSNYSDIENSNKISYTEESNFSRNKNISFSSTNQSPLSQSHFNNNKKQKDLNLNSQLSQIQQQENLSNINNNKEKVNLNNTNNNIYQTYTKNEISDFTKINHSNLQNSEFHSNTNLNKTLKKINSKPTIISQTNQGNSGIKCGRSISPALDSSNLKKMIGIMDKTFTEKDKTIKEIKENPHSKKSSIQNQTNIINSLHKKQQFSSNNIKELTQNTINSGKPKIQNKKELVFEVEEKIVSNKNDHFIFEMNKEILDPSLNNISSLNMVIFFI